MFKWTDGTLINLSHISMILMSKRRPWRGEEGYDEKSNAETVEQVRVLFTGTSDFYEVDSNDGGEEIWKAYHKWLSAQ